MAGKKRSKKAEDDDLEAVNLPPIFADPIGAEKALFELGKILDQQDFSSEKELNDFLQNLIVRGQPLPSLAPSTPLEEAQEVMYEAWTTLSPTRRIKLAKKALSISKDCADAYVLLAEESAKSFPEAIRLYEQGVAAGERAIGLDEFQEYVGVFWGVLETRPYMRAREGLASALWAMGDTEAAIDHFQDMLRLNPDDNQGIRYYLLSLYLEAENDAALQELLKRYKNDYSAQWFYTQALVAFRKYGDGIRSSKKLRAALDYNPFVPPYLLGRKRLPKEQGPYISPGNEDEAIDYASDGLRFWHETPGALDWLRTTVDKSNP
ncbi:ST7 protein [Candidatus Promineifilum breve]|uniref:ST7 protein n=1 Tax=Candidatus Promineifilum breve TaxID=1806508 RepID=A0A160SZV1_9CHLR|nr:tetratricopeptide repeat protein [Candidatus Promineifilum breve]CUS02976.2 ST7 protein [Candidatus Promineifilum breve]